MFIPSSLGLQKRYNNCDGGFFGGNCNGFSSWDSWGRYVVLAGVIVVVIILFFVVGCITARRRRQRGAQPYYGTGWIGGRHGNVNYYGPNGGAPPPAPEAAPQSFYGNQQYGQQAYSQPAPPYTAGAGQTYYGSRNVEPGIELQTPETSYQTPAPTGGEAVYSPPAGPPPGKKGDIVR